MKQKNEKIPFIIAEMSGNHNQSLERALKIVDAIAETGVDALKLQTYTADTMTIPVNNGDFLIEDKKSLWHGKNLHELYQEAYTPWEWHAPIFEKARELTQAPVLAWFYLGQTFAKKDDVGLALEAYDQGLKIKPLFEFLFSYDLMVS